MNHYTIAEQVRIAKALLAMRRAGQLAGLWIDGGVIQVEYPRRLYRVRITWHAAAELARRAANAKRRAAA